MPRTGEQLALYRSVLDAAGEQPVTFRTLDIGGDKVLPYMRDVEEENPALGWRAIRLGLDRPGLLRSQIRALLRAAGGRELRDHVPDGRRPSTSSTRPRRLVERELTHLRRHGHTLPERVEVGAMVEVPSLLFQLDELLERVDFLSVGSNDLMQFLYRGRPRQYARVAIASTRCRRRCCARSRMIADKAAQHGKPVTLCGELASQPIGALALVASAIARCRCRPRRSARSRRCCSISTAAKARDALLPLLDTAGRQRFDPRDSSKPSPTAEGLAALKASCT